MRINFLAVITGVFICCFVTVSCLDSNKNDYEYSSDATIRGFALDSIYKDTYYTFTIDQINGKIYNEDSIPVHADTIISKIRVTTITTNGIVTAGDSLFNMNDSIDLTEPLILEIRALDGVHKKEYEIRVNRHTQDPDSLVWSDGPVSRSFSNGTVTGEQKAVTLNGAILVYPFPGVCYVSSGLSADISWNRQSTQGLPADADIHSIMLYRDKLYAAADGDAYTSSDGLNWEKSALLSGQVVTFLAPFREGLSGIITNAEGERIFSVTDAEGEYWLEDNGKVVPTDFPLTQISYAASETSNKIERIFLTGTSPKPSVKTVLWQSYDGYDWASLDGASDDYVPYMEHPTILYYDDDFYVFGDGFTTFYKSSTGVNWEEAEGKFLFPETFEGRSRYYSTVLDDKGYIWIIWSKTIRQNDEVWRGRLNRVGFKKHTPGN